MSRALFVRGRGLPAVALFASAALGAAPTFTGLTDPFVGGYVDRVLGVSAAGTVVVGYSYKPTSPDFGDRSFRWQAGVGFDNPGPTQGVTLSYASGVSADGSVVAGDTGHAQFGDQEAWIRVGSSRGHVGSPSGTDFSVLTGVSLDGAIAVGWGGPQSDPNAGEAAFYNTDTDQWTTIGFLSGGSVSKAMAASGDGSVIVGLGSVSQYVSSAFVWTSAAGMQPVGGTGNLPGGEEGVAIGVSADGSVIVGTDYVRDAQFNSTYTTWRWTQATGMVAIATDFFPSGISPDGVVIVGTSQANGYNEPAIWDEAHGMRNLEDLLADQGLHPAWDGWSMSGATAINQTGVGEDAVYAIAGEGGDPAGYIAGWVVTMSLAYAPPLPVCDGDVTGDGLTNSADFNVMASTFGASVTPNSSGDLTGDGIVNSADFNVLAGDFGCGG